MLDLILSFGVFWGIWLIAPILIDGFTTVATLIGVFSQRRSRKTRLKPLEFTPFISVVVPVYNSADTLGRCLESIARQDYPLGKIEVMVINNGSMDNSFEVFAEMQTELDLNLTWHSILNKGKAWALNAGIHMARGSYIFNVDSDVVLAPEAFRNVVVTMESESDLGAITGAIQVLPSPENASPLQKVINECEFLEYLTAFHVGREFQTILQNLYTLSGAFSVFRREVLLQTFLYNQETVTEDTDITFEIYERLKEWRVGCVTSAIAYVHPIESLPALYSQRVRWQRGQIEVSARHPELLKHPMWQTKGFSPGRILVIDHTLAFPRLVWTFFLPVLTIFGYPLSLIILAFILLYAFYLLIDVLWLIVAWMGVDEIARGRLKKIWWFVIGMPLYRMVIFWFRFSGFLHAAAEPGIWTVQDPIVLIQDGWADLRGKFERIFQH